MKTALLRLSSISLVFFAAATADADIIRLDARPSWSQYPVVGDTVSVDIYLDCECAGSAQDDPSDYVFVQFSVLFDDQVYSYLPSASLPHTLPLELTGAPDPGHFVFGPFPPAAGTLIISNSDYYSSWPNPYYGGGLAIGGGPHPLKVGTSNQVLIQYLTRNFVGWIANQAGGERLLGTLVFRLQALGSPALIGARMSPDDMIYIYPEGAITTANGGVTVSGDFTIPAPEPARGTLLAAGIASLGLLARARRSGRMRRVCSRGREQP
jgi:hypothetical protein